MATNIADNQDLAMSCPVVRGARQKEKTIPQQSQKAKMKNRPVGWDFCTNYLVNTRTFYFVLLGITVLMYTSSWGSPKTKVRRILPRLPMLPWFIISTQ